jgi:hypothetical protein
VVSSGAQPILLAGTLGYESKFRDMKFVDIQKLGLKVSRIGMGTFRMRKPHESVLESAICSGINIIDTSSHFGSGEAERVIGQTLTSLFSKGLVQRSVQDFYIGNSYLLQSRIYIRPVRNT